MPHVRCIYWQVSRNNTEKKGGEDYVTTVFRSSKYELPSKRTE